MKKQIKLRVNGQEREIIVEPWQTLLDALRYDLGLTGTKEGCSNGNCGSCTILLGGQPVNSCLVLAVEVEGDSSALARRLAESGLTVREEDRIVIVGLEDDRAYDLIRDSVVDLGFGLVRLEQRRQMLEDLFRSQEPEAGDGASS